MAMRRVLLVFALGLCAGSAPGARAGETTTGEAPDAGAVLPGNGVAVLYLADAAGLKKALAASDFGALWAEPECQAFLKPAWDALLERYGEMRKENPLLPGLNDLDKTLTGELALTVALPAKPGEVPAVCAAIRVGDAQAAARTLAPLLGGRPLAEGTAVPLGPEGGPALLLEKGWLLFSSSGEGLQQMRGRLADPAKRGAALASSKPLTAARKLLGGPGHLTLCVDVQALLQMALAQEQGNARAAQIKEQLAKAGVSGVQALAFQLGTRGEQLALDTALVLDGPAKGVVAVAFDPRPIPAAALKGVPEKATFCSVSRFDSKALLALLRGLLEADKLQEFEKGLAAAQEALGLDVEKVLLPVLGETWVLYDVGGADLFGLLPGLAVSVAIQDPAKAQHAVDTLLEAAEKGLAAHQEPFGPQADVREVKLGEVRVRYLNVSSMPLSPSVAVAKDRLVFTLSVASMRRALAQLGAPRDITAAPGFKAALERVTGKPLDLAALPGQFSYADPGSGSSSLTAAASLLQVMAGGARMASRVRRGAANPGAEAAWSILDKLDFALFPSDEVFGRHMRPSASALVGQAGGVVLRSDLAVPSMGALSSGQGGFFAASMVAAIAVPNLLRSRMAANESAALAACKTYAEAQDIYRRTDWDEDGLLEYAQSIRGKNSLYEKNEGTGDLTLVDAAFANAEVQSAVKPIEEKDIPEPKAEDRQELAKHLPKLSSDDFGEREAASGALEKLGPGVLKLLEKEVKENKDTEVRERCRVLVEKLKLGLSVKQGVAVKKAVAPKAGYYFKVLSGQGPNPPGGRKSYIVARQGAQANSMTLGYALVAYPAQYDGTGRNTFLINNTGTVYQKDLGPETQMSAEGMTEYNPDNTWVVDE